MKLLLLLRWAQVPSPGLMMKVGFSLLAAMTLLSPVRAAVSVSPAKEGEQCAFPDGAVGRCEELVTCLKDRGVVRRNNNIVVCNSNNLSRLVACCRRPHQVAKEMCSVWARYWLVKSPDGNQTCTSTTPLIHGGEEADLGEFPNMAAVGIGQSGDRIKWVCGGSLITPSFVLTAAHCVSNPDMWVGLGEHDLTFRGGGSLTRLDYGMPPGLVTPTRARQLRNIVETEQRIRVTERIVHPEYQRNYHDIALLRLQQPAVLTNRVLPACLPPKLPDRYTTSSVFTVSGWGNRAFGTPLSGPQNSRKLQKVNIGHIDSIRCSHEFSRQAHVGVPPLGITTDLICAGSPGKDSCGGDSGGPLMQKADLPSRATPCQPQVVAGVVSFGPPCSGLGAYTRVSSYIDWITGIVAPRLLPGRDE